MRTITITTNDRPDNLRTMLASLVQNDLTGYEIFARCEPGTPQCVALLREYLPAAHIAVNERKLGVRNNPFQVLVDAFLVGSQFNLYLEDDLVLAPDAVAVANWYYEQQLPNALCLNLLNYGSCGDDHTAMLRREEAFNALGLGVTRQSWEAHFRPQWFVDDPEDRSTGWDWSLHRYLRRRGELYTVQPALSRSNHTGRYGTYCRPAFHDRTFGNLPVASLPGPHSYRLVII